MQNAVADELAVPNVVDRAIFQAELDALRLQEKAHTREGFQPYSIYSYVWQRTERSTGTSLGCNVLREFLTIIRADLIERCRLMVAKRLAPKVATGHRPRPAMPATALDAKSNQQETAMRRLKSFAVVVGLMLSTTIIADSKKASAQGIEALPRDVEMELASSALPAPLQEAATIYVLDPHKGFVVARKGTNSFHALVARTGDDAFRGSWPLTEYPPDVLYPVSFDAAGARAHMQVIFDIAEAQAKGMPAAELKQLIQERFRTGHYQPPARAGISYMLAPIMRTYDDPEQSPKISTASHPHVMHFAPNVSGQDVGSGELGGVYPHIIMPGPHGLIVQALDTKEKAAINKRHAGLTQKLCKLKQAWCLPKEQEHH